MKKQSRYGHPHHWRLPADVKAGPATCTICGQVKFDGRTTRTKRFLCEGAEQQRPHWVTRDPTRGNPEDGFTRRCLFCTHLARVAAPAVAMPVLIRVLLDGGSNAVCPDAQPRVRLMRRVESAIEQDSAFRFSEPVQEQTR